MSDQPTDRQLSKSLRQAALRFEAQTREIESLTATTKPLPDKLSVFDFISVLRKAKNNNQIQIIFNMVSELYNDDPDIMVDSDWTLISRVASNCKVENNNDF